MKHLLLVALVCTAPLMTSVPARAGKQEQAMALFEQGQKLYEAEKYGDALKAFQKAYKLEPAPLLFVNIAQCHRQLGNHEAAIAALERYLKDEPEADNKAEVEELLASERAILNPPPVEEAPPPAPEPAPVAAPAPVEPAPAVAANDGGEDSLLASPGLWMAVGGAALVVVVGGAAAVAIATQPPPLQPTGSLGTFDLR